MSDGMRPRIAPKTERWTLEWVRDRIKCGHHQALCKYLRHRTPEQEAEAERNGISIDLILRTGFLVKNGHTSVPESAIKVFRHVPGATAPPVIAICRASADTCGLLMMDTLPHLQNLAKTIVKKIPREDMDDETRLFVDEMAIRHVMES